MSKDSTSAFVEEAKGVLHDLRSALAGLVAAVGADATQPQEIARRFGLDKTLTWKIARVICDDDTMASAVHVPGRSSVRNLVETLGRNGAPTESTTLVQDAMDRLEQLIETHCGDRRTFEVMLGGSSNGAASKQAENARKMFYQGASAIWGVQARVHASLHFVAPSEDESKLDLGVIAGFLGFRRLRADVPWTVASMSTFVQDGTPKEHQALRPMDPGLRPGSAPLLKRFCTSPEPQLRETPGRNSTTRYELAEGPIGNTAATNCILGWVAGGEVCRYRSPGDLIGEHVVRLSTPVEVLYHDLYVHRSLGFAMNPTIHLYSDLPGGPIFPYDGPERGRLPVLDEVVDLGENPPNASAADIPNYRQMVSFGAEQMGWTLNDFRGFRFRLKYPPIPTLAVYRYDLPEKA